MHVSLGYIALSCAKRSCAMSLVFKSEVKKQITLRRQGGGVSLKAFGCDMSQFFL